MNNHGGNIRAACEKYSFPFNKFIDFSANINPLGFPKKIKRLLIKNIGSIAQYPDIDYMLLRNGLAEYSGVAAGNITVGNGAAELIHIITRALSPKKALISTPTFSEYEYSVNLIAGNCLFVKTDENDNFELNINGLIKYLPRVDIVFICNPNNPTGYVLSRNKILYFASECKKNNVILVVDESFIEFVPGMQDITAAKNAARTSNILVLRSLTKFFALPGLRIGYLIGREDLIKSIAHFMPPWSVNCHAQIAGNEVIRDSVYIDKSRKYIFRERDFLFNELCGIKSLKPYQPAANFILCKLVNTGLNSKKTADILGMKGILVRDCSNFRGLNDKFIRIAVKKREENKKLVKVLKSIFPEYCS